jgi:two-component system phosphate regulon sensor histidine kinase PhoR
MTGKIFKSIFLSCLAVFILTFALTFGFSYKYYLDRTGEMLSGEAEYVKQGLLTVGDAYLDGIEEFSARVTIVTEDGTVIYDSLAEGGNLSVFENHRDREEISEAFETGEGSAVRYSDSLGTRSVYYAVRLEDGRVLRLATEHYTVLSALMSIFGPMLVLFFFVLLFAFLIAKKLSGTIVRPINEIDLNRPESADVYDELKPIILKLSSQNYRVSRQMDELKMR